MAFKLQRIRDPVHDLIEFYPNEFEHALWCVLQTRPFQRLRRVKQLAFSELVYPGATHSRFAHSVGVFHTARRLMTIIESQVGAKEFRETQAKFALAAALVHDVGHGPFSHAFEEVGRRFGLKMAEHEHVTEALIRDGEIKDTFDAELGKGFAENVAGVIAAEGPQDVYGAVVSSQFDADRLDYMQRDRLMTGTQHAAIDFRWLLSNLEVDDVPYGVDDKQVGTRKTFVLGAKAFFAAEAYVLGLFQLYPTVYFHKTTRGAEKLFTELLARVIQVTRNGHGSSTGLPLRHPLLSLATDSGSVDLILPVDDTVIWGAISMMAEAADETISLFARRLRDRKLLKCTDVRDLVSQAIGEKDTARVAAACAHIAQSVRASPLSGEAGGYRILIDEVERAPYKRFDKSKGPLNQIRIRSEGQKLVDLAEKSRVVGALETFRVFRLYCARDDVGALELIKQTIQAGVDHAKRV